MVLISVMGIKSHSFSLLLDHELSYATVLGQLVLCLILSSLTDSSTSLQCI